MSAEVERDVCWKCGTPQLPLALISDPTQSADTPVAERRGVWTCRACDPCPMKRELEDITDAMINETAKTPDLAYTITG